MACRFTFFFFFNDTATTEIYTLSLHDALPISSNSSFSGWYSSLHSGHTRSARRDRKSTRLNSSHQIISYAVFCLKKKKLTIRHPAHRSGRRVGTGVLVELFPDRECTAALHGCV